MYEQNGVQEENKYSEVWESGKLHYEEMQNCGTGRQGEEDV